MASPQLEQGYTRIANEILDHLITDAFGFLNGLECRLILAILRKTYGWQKKSDYISYSQLASMTASSRRSVIYAVQNLECKLLIKVNRQKDINLITFNKDWETWLVQNSAPQVEKNRTLAKSRSAKLRTSAKLHDELVQNSDKKVKSFAPTKETITKERITKETSVAKAPQEDLRKIVNKYFDLQSYEESDRRASFPRHVRDAKDLLQACGGDSGRAVAVLDALHAWGSKKKLSYTIGTALKRWKDFSGTGPPLETWDARMARVNAEIEKYKSANNL